MTDETKAQIEKHIQENDVFVFMKGTPDFPQCGFSAATVECLQHTGVKFGTSNVLEDQGIREGIKSFANWPTIPQVYVKGEFIGGCDIVRQMHANGELSTLLKEKGLIS